MNKNRIKWSVAIFTLLVLVILVLQGPRSVSGSQPSSFDSPVAASVAPGPTPTPVMFRETQRALERIAAREGIPVKQLVAVNLRQREYKLLGKTFWFVTAQNLEGDQWYSVMVNLADGSFVDDIETLEQAEQEAHFAKYGKLEPALFDRLESMKPDDKVMVAIWVVDNPKRSREELFAALATKHPEARAALERSGKPFDVGDPQLANALEAEYVKMLEEDTLPLLQPLKDALQAQEYTVTTFGAMPVIAVTLPKDLILKIAARPDVGAVYLVGKMEKHALDSAVSSDRVPIVWQRGFKGSGIGIGILEGGKVDFTGPVGHNYLHQGQVRPCSGGESQHKTLVASVAASYHGVYTGVAPEATVHDACTDGTDVDTVAGLSWATDRADPINFSAGFEGDGQLHFTDKAFDYWAFQGNDTVVKSAGNNGNYITSPGNGWNVITVGGSDDKGNANWSDDEWWSSSGWKNPVGSIDREKPEVVAPAKSITAITLDNATGTGDGTSLAAPQVTGLAALLINRNSNLSIWPEAVKAIIMASAVHDIVYPSTPTVYDGDVKDGAGGIDAALADTTAKTQWSSPTDPCIGPCWWGFGIDNTNFPVGQWVSRYFMASRGERIRVAISWWSHANCADASHCNFDRLDTNLNLTVYFPNGQFASSERYDNNYELVEFVAPATGQYRIGVYKASANETSNDLGIAWVKDATYLPDLRGNKDGWVSTYCLRNDGATARDVRIDYFNADGSSTPQIYDLWQMNPNNKLICPSVGDGARIPNGTVGSAIVSGGEDVSVVVRNRNGDELDEYNGILPSGSSGPLGWEQTGATLYAPFIKNHRNGRWTFLSIANVGSAATDANVQFYDILSGTPLGTPTPYNLAPNASTTVGPGWCTSATSRCSAKITSSSGQPLAIVIREQDDATVNYRATSNAFSAGGTSNFAPLVKKNFGTPSQTTGLVIQNIGTQATDVSAACYSTSGTYYACGTYNGLPPNATVIFGVTTLPDGFLGSAVVSSSGQPIVTLIYETGGSWQQVTNAPLSGSTVAYAPELYGSRTQDGQTWNSGLTIQNTSSVNTANITVTYYYASGAWAGQWTSQIGSRLTWVLNYNRRLMPGPEFLGSAVVTSDQPVVATISAYHTGTGDVSATYTASNR